MTKKMLGSIALLTAAFAAVQPASASVLHVVPAQSATEFPGAMLPAGTPINTRIQTQLSTHYAHYGDHFSALVTTPITDGKGGMIIPSGARVEGYVRTADRGHGVTGTARFDLAATQVVINGRSVPIEATQTSAALQTYHRGFRLRQHARLLPGASVSFMLTEPIATAQLRRANPFHGIGGGPMFK